MINTNNILTILKSDVSEKTTELTEIENELDELEERKNFLNERKSNLHFFIDKTSKTIDIIERDSKNEKSFEEIHPHLV